MVEERRIRKGNYIIALILTICIFAIGVLLGALVTNERIKYMEQTSDVQRLEYDSMQLQYMYLNTIVNDDEACVGATKTLEENIKELEETRKRLEEYSDKSIKVNREEFQNLKRDYILSEIRYWLLVNQAEKICKSNLVTILYFYSIGECSDCTGQGMILDNIKKELKENILIFSFDADFKGEPMLDILKESYNITDTPTMVIENRKFTGLVPKSEVLAVLCSYYKNEIETCKNLQKA